MAPLDDLNATFETPELDAQRAAIMAQLPSVRNRFNTDLAASIETPKASPGQALLQGLLAVIPMIAGRAIAGNAGGAIGAQSGLTGATAYGKKIDDQNKEKQGVAKLQAASDQKDLETLTGEKTALEKLKATQQFSHTEKTRDLGQSDKNSQRAADSRVAAAGAARAPDAPFKDADVTAVAAKLAPIQDIQQTLNDFKSTIPKEMLSESYFDKDGNFSFDGAADIIRRYGEQKLLGGATPQGKAAASLSASLSATIKNLSGTAVNDAEFQRIKNFVTGDGILPADIPTVLNLLGQYQRRLASSAVSETEVRQGLRQPDPTGFVKNRVATMLANDTAPAPSSTDAASGGPTSTTVPGTPAATPTAAPRATSTPNPARQYAVSPSGQRIYWEPGMDSWELAK